MGKKGSWLSAIKRVFTPNSKEKLVHGSEKKGVKEKKKWGLGRLKHGESHSFMPLYREPSSIEKILGDAEREHQRTPTMHSREHQRTPSIPSREHHKSPSIPFRDHQQTHSLPSRAHHYKAIATPNYHQSAAIKIQTAYRGYLARRSFRALKGLVRLQGVVRGQNVKRQTMHAMRCMQLLVRVQSQIHCRRIQMMEIQSLQRQNLHRIIDKDLESSLGKGTMTHLSETEQLEDWDDSVLTKEEIEARMQRKVEAVIKRERALAYAYSHQLWKGTPKSAHTALMEIRSGGFPWWWNWLERQLPSHTPEDPTARFKNNVTPSKPSPEPNARIKPHNYKQPKFSVEGFDVATPRSGKSSPMMKAKHVPILTVKTPQNNSPAHSKPMKPRTSMDGHSLGAALLRDDESLTSCPSFSVPNYMVPTVSAKAKVRAHSIPKERSAAPAERVSKKRLSFPLTHSIGALFTGKDSTSQRMSGNHKSLQSIGNLSVDSTISLPVGVGRKPFQRFV
ncbi:protein IQ-DOMAIN 13 [Magnolia sinica]|uniref:protein IQ-DOMAIN 13 n=1 Tax=Magnolia sinica TaxID=86752 RepID=UPI00265B267A|nr:protein IQ-DOMAIN 13 [Magnolia sinica]